MNMAGTGTDVSRGRNSLGVGPSQQLGKTEELTCSVLWSPLPHTTAPGEWCFGGRTEEDGVELGMRLEERRAARASEVERQEGCRDTAPEK